jgi:hypothetical protein
MKKYLSANAAIINNSHFERALAKLQSGRKLTPVESAASARLLAPTVEMTTPSEVDGESFAQQAFKRRRLARPKDLFIDTEFVPPTPTSARDCSLSPNLSSPTSGAHSSQQHWTCWCFLGRIEICGKAVNSVIVRQQYNINIVQLSLSHVCTSQSIFQCKLTQRCVHHQPSPTVSRQQQQLTIAPPGSSCSRRRHCAAWR